MIRNKRKNHNDLQMKLYERMRCCGGLPNWCIIAEEKVNK